MKILKREKRKLELYLEKIEIDMLNKIDEIEKTYEIDEEYHKKMLEAHKIAEDIQKTKFEICLLKTVTNTKKREENE